MMELFRYIVRYDCGFAPSPFHSYCTIAACKPQIRQAASVGDWIVGVGGTGKPSADKLMYMMQVGEKLTYAEYWNDARFLSKRPRYDSSLKWAFGDNIYYRSPSGDWQQLDSHHSNADGTVNHEHLQRDTGADAVLVAHRFSYFGCSALSIPASLELIPTARRGYQRSSGPEARDAAIQWLETLPQGYCGRPADWPAEHG